MQIYKEILHIWNIEFDSIIDANIYGALSRMAGRTAVLDKNGRKYLVEKHHFWNLDKKLKIAENIEIINSSGFSVCTPYLKNKEGKAACEFKNRVWMIQPFIENDLLKRPDYLDDWTKGKNAAVALLKLYEVTSDRKMNDIIEGFSLVTHTEDLISKIKKSYPEIHTELKDVIHIIEQLFNRSIKDSRLIFCHGDYHPMNILWKNDTVVSVIDWEFSGYRPALTDVANIIGCAGFENRNAIDRDFVKEFIKIIENSGFFSDSELKNLMLFVLGFRFSGWLNEWINDRDIEMIQREINYLKILAEML
ncbi:MAG TPA: phosphotransferase [bacterium]|nr:phosphotransferase [bacterium]HPS30128.1 phosphotransferase [bacterium]